MTLKTLLSVVGVDQSDADIETALALAADGNAHLSVFVVSVAAAPPVGEYAAMISEPWMEERKADLANLKKRTDEVTKLISASELSVDVTGDYSEAAWTDEVVGQRARYADLTLIGPELRESDRLGSFVLNGALFDSGKPVLVLPKRGAATLSPKRVMIAWDSRLEASRAVSEALPLLAGAEQVHVAMVDPVESSRESGPEPGADIATYLARHGVNVTVDRLPSGERTTANVLGRHAVDVSAELIVMGAYRHSRLRERIFGGVTRTMLEEPPVPLFMAH